MEPAESGNEPSTSGSLYWKLGSGSFPVRGTPGGQPGRIGSYLLLDVLGEGGMGVVYLAEQTEPVRRQVALKLIRSGLSSRQVVARFESERQALALMSHPGIARVFDAGASEDGSPYFVMELVQGEPITQHCDERSLGARARLELFVQACEAVQHAHQRGIIHRDIKPSNVLVTVIDGTPAPKIIDFGIAKAMREGSADDPTSAPGTALTEAGQIIGTPEYMSPEQAGLDERDIDTRTDIYSLGVLLYELCTGVLPFDSTTLRQGGIAGILRTICEVIPEKPSTRLERLRRERRERHEPDGPRPHTVHEKELRGDLDWIILKALEKDRTRRYASASELSGDVNRHLACEPVLAGPPGALYRLEKLVRRHREKVIAAAVLIVLLVSSFVAFSIHSRQRELRESRELIAEGQTWSKDFVELSVEKERLRQALAERETESPPWLPPWERGEEMRLRLDLAAIQKKADSSYSEALFSFDRAVEAAPADSNERTLVRKAAEAILWERHKEAALNGDVRLPPEFFKRQIESLGLGTHAAELEGKGRIALESEPDGAEVHCFRFEESEQHLLPLPFSPAAGLADPEKGLLGGPFLRVEKIWRPAGSPFQPGDRLLEVAGSPVATLGSLAKSLERASADEAIAARVLRGGEAIEIRWTPFPAELYVNRPTIRPGKLLDVYTQLGMTFEGYPLDFAGGSLVGVTRVGAAVSAELPRGSYIFVLRKPGYAECRVPVSIPADSRARSVRLFRAEDLPQGFVHVPAGELPAGGDEAAYEGLARAREMVPDFYMSRLEVTFGEYLEFVRDLDRRGEIDSDGFTKLGESWNGPELAALRPESGREHDRVYILPQSQTVLFERRSQPDGASRFESIPNTEFPAFGISMMAGVEYASWRTAKSAGRWRFRLPRDLEWEKAARGADARSFVWGSDLVLTFCRSADGCIPERSSGRPEIVGTYPLDESVYGVRDLAGSIAEPTLTRALKNRRMHVYRGGDWTATDVRDFRAASRNRAIPERMYRYLGLRLVAENN